MNRYVVLLAVLGLLTPVGSTLAEDPPQANRPDFTAQAARGAPWRGDLDAMVERRVVRVLVAYSRTHYFLDGAEPRGLSWTGIQFLEEVLNDELDTGNLKVYVVAVPTPRDEVLQALIDGRGDIAMANLTITPERRRLVDFSDPFLKDIRELVVTGPGGPGLTSIEDLAGAKVHVPRSSSFHESLESLNRRFRAEGRPPVEIIAADERLEIEDLLEMVSAGLLPATVADSHIAEFWAEILGGLRLDREIAVRRDGEIAWAFRKDSPRLAEVLNRFVAKHKKGTLLGNITLKRYLENTAYVRNAAEAEGLRRFREVAPYFKTHAETYGFDWLLLIAQAYQESGLDQSARSAAGAVGVMQLLPSTAADKNIGIPDISTVDANVHAGAKYMRFILDRYFADQDLEPIDEHLFAFAAYNAGPARVRGLRAEAAASDLDPNVWSDNVERVAARQIGRETVQYVSNIFKYYLTYRRLADRGHL